MHPGSGRADRAVSERLYLGATTVEACVSGVSTMLGRHRAADDDRRVPAVPAFLRR